jgi:ribose transport system permease protein
MTEKSADGARLTDAAQDVHQPARAVPAEIAPTVTGESSRRSLPPGLMRNLGLVIALVLLCIVGVITAGDRFARTDNVLTILRLASVIGVVSIGMTFVITAGGIDLSVGAVVGLASVWATTSGTQLLANDVHWLIMVSTALLVGTAAGLLNGLMVAYGRIVPFIATLAMMAAARGLAEILANRQTQIIRVNGFLDFFEGALLGVPVLVWVFALVAVAGWILLNRTTFGRRTFAVGGNPEAARLAGIRVKRQTMMLYGLVGLSAGIAAVMIMARTTAGSSTHGTLYELDAIAAVVIGGTLLTGGVGYVVGTLFGVLMLGIIQTLIAFDGTLSSWWTRIVVGLLLLAFCLLQRLLTRRTPRPA